MPQEGKQNTKRSPSYISTIVSISLVLFMLGLLGLVVLHAKKLSDYVKENIVLSVMVKESTKEVEVIHLQKMFDAANYIKTTRYISEDEAADILSAELGEDFVGFLGYNPLLSSIDIQLHASYANSDSITWIKEEIMQYDQVKEIFYERSLIDKINDNLKTIGLIILVFSIILLMVVIALINNTIRLALYSKRFLIKSMQLVGATQGFIRRPFIYKGITHGLYSGIISTIALIILMYFAQSEIPELVLLQDFQYFIILGIFIIAIGVFISWWSTSIAIRKYLRMKLDDLY